jgi:hypothetical protein
MTLSPINVAPPLPVVGRLEPVSTSRVRDLEWVYAYGPTTGGDAQLSCPSYFIRGSASFKPRETSLT